MSHRALAILVRLFVLYVIIDSLAVFISNLLGGRFGSVSSMVPHLLMVALVTLIAQLALAAWCWTAAERITPPDEEVLYPDHTQKENGLLRAAMLIGGMLLIISALPPLLALIPAVLLSLSAPGPGNAFFQNQVMTAFLEAVGYNLPKLLFGGWLLGSQDAILRRFAAWQNRVKPEAYH